MSRSIGADWSVGLAGGHSGWWWNGDEAQDAAISTLGSGGGGGSGRATAAKRNRAESGGNLALIMNNLETEEERDQMSQVTEKLIKQNPEVLTQSLVKVFGEGEEGREATSYMP